MKIYSASGEELLDFLVDDKSYRYKAVMDDNTMTLYFNMPEFHEIPQGSYCDFKAERYFLLEDENFKQNHSRDFEYTLILDSSQSLTKEAKFKFFTMNAGVIDSPFELKFSLTATPREFAQRFVDNMNIYDPAGGWSVGSCIESDPVCIDFNHDYCFDVLAKIVDAFKTEWEFDNKTLNIGKVEKSKDSPIPLKYGYNCGLLPGTSRANMSSSKVISRLFIEGSDRNIDSSTYGATTLHMPKSTTITYEGVQYRTDATGTYLERVTPVGRQLEGSVDLTKIYPKRIGTVSAVTVVNATTNLYDIVDSSIPDTLNFASLVIGGETMTIVFQTGQLAGKEFDVAYKAADKRFEIVPTSDNGVNYPSGSLIPEIGDKYAVFHIDLPNEYKTQAETDVLNEAVKYLWENEQPKYTYTGTLDEIYAKRNWLEIGGKMNCGYFVALSDDNYLTTPVSIRIVGVKEYINKPKEPEITLSNEVTGRSLSSELNKTSTQEQAIDRKDSEVVRFARRQFADVKQTTEMLQNSLLNFSGSISPLTVQTMQLIAGDETLQFVFVANSNSTASVAHNEIYNPTTKQFISSAGIIQHKTLGVTTLSSSHAASELKWWQMSAYISPVLDDSTKSYYLYAKVSKTDNTGVFLLSETAIALEGVDGYYHLLMGILNSENDGDRSYSQMYGYSELTPARLTTKKIASPSGNTFFDLENEVIQGNIKFQSGVSVESGISTAKSEAISTAASDATTKANAAVNNLQIGGTNLMSINPGFEKYFPSGGGLYVNAEQGINTLATRFINNGNDGTLRVNITYQNPIKESGWYSVSFKYKHQAGGVLDYIIEINDSYVGSIYKETVENIWKEFKGSVYVDRLIGTHGFVDIQAAGGNWADVLISDFMVEKGNKPSDWTLAVGDINQSIGVAKQAADNAQTSANTANSSIAAFNTYVDGSFKDGVISQSEAQSIEKYKNQVTKDFNDLIAGYNVVYTNSYLIGSAKSDLLNAKVSISGAKDNLLASINAAIADGKTTVSEKADVDSKYSTWDSSYSTYKSKLELANKAIQANLDSLAQQAAANAQSAATAVANTAQNSANTAQSSVDNLQIGVANLMSQNPVVTYVPSNGSYFSLNSENGIKTKAHSFTNVGSSDAFRLNITYQSPLVEVGKYTISFWYKHFAGGVLNWNVNINDIYFGTMHEDSVLNTWIKFEKTAYIEQYVGVYGFLDFRSINSNWAGVLISDLMIVKGSKIPSTYISPQEDTQAKISSLDYLKAAFGGSTEINGGVVASNVMLLKNLQGAVTGGLSGLTTIPGTSNVDNVLLFGGSTYQQALDGISKLLITKDGKINAQDAVIKGIIQAVSGKIGGLNVVGNTLTSGTIEFADTAIESLSQLQSPITVSISRQSSWTGIKSAYTQNFYISQPSTIKIYISITNGAAGETLTLSIIDSNGINVYTENPAAGSSGSQFGINLQSGTYHVELSSNNPSSTATVVISGAPSTPDTISVVGFVSKTKIGNNGIFSFKDSSNYIYYNQSGLFEMRAGVAGGIQCSAAGVKYWNGGAWIEIPRFDGLRPKSSMPNTNNARALYVDTTTGLVYKEG